MSESKRKAGKKRVIRKISPEQAMDKTAERALFSEVDKNVLGDWKKAQTATRSAARKLESLEQRMEKAQASRVGANTEKQKERAKQRILDLREKLRDARRLLRDARNYEKRLLSLMVKLEKAYERERKRMLRAYEREAKALLRAMK